MKYTLTEDDGVVVVRAVLRAKEDYDELIEKITANRDHYYPPKKEEPNE